MVSTGINGEKDPAIWDGTDGVVLGEMGLVFIYTILLSYGEHRLQIPIMVISFVAPKLIASGYLSVSGIFVFLFDTL